MIAGPIPVVATLGGGTEFTCPPLARRAAATFEELRGFLLHGAPVALIAMDAIPALELGLQALRQAAPLSRLVLIYQPGTPRRRLSERLWAVGLVDHVVDDSNPEVLTRVLRQTYADAMLDHALEKVRLPDGDPGQPYLRFLHRLTASPVTKRRLESVVRDVARGLLELVDFDCLEVLVLEEGGAPRLFTSQVRRLEHATVWNVAVELTRALGYFGIELRVEKLAFLDVGLELREPNGTRGLAPLVLPMVVAGEVVGGFGIVPAAPLTTAQRTMLDLAAHQIGLSVSYASALEAADRAAVIDELTGVPNRRYLNAVLASEWRRALRYRQPLSVAMVDLDHFKEINDSQGHGAGDAALKGFAALLARGVRDSDVVTRYGGDEFLIIFHNTAPNEAMQVLERVRATVPAGPCGAPLAFSAGLAGHPEDRATSLDELLSIADQALQAAKQAGRGQIRRFEARARIRAGGTQSNLKVSRPPSLAALSPGQPVTLIRPPRERIAATVLADGPSGLSLRVDRLLDPHSLVLLCVPAQDQPVACAVTWVEGQVDGVIGLRRVASAELAGAP